MTYTTFIGPDGSPGIYKHNAETCECSECDTARWQKIERENTKQDRGAIMNAQITYIQVDEFHRIEVAPSGRYYPQSFSTMWGYYKVGNKARSYKTETGARKFIASWK